jgi:hypothetical protein
MKLGISVPFGDGGTPRLQAKRRLIVVPKRDKDAIPRVKIGGFSRKASEEIAVVQTSVTAGALRRFVFDTPAESPGLCRRSDQ